jgi:hypothetical protein
MSDSLKNIDLETVTGGLGFATTNVGGTPTSRRPSSSSSSLALQTQLTNLTSELDSLKNNNNNNSLNQLLPVAIMAKWMRQNG